MTGGGGWYGWCTTHPAMADSSGGDIVAQPYTPKLCPREGTGTEECSAWIPTSTILSYSDTQEIKLEKGEKVIDQVDTSGKK